MRFTLAQVAQVTDGFVLGDPAIEISGASIDSRSVRPGALFIPIIASRDGHDFIDAAMAAGAAGHLTSSAASTHPAVAVSDTTHALQLLGTAARARLGHTVGITGSVGKTTTKDLLAAVAATSLRTHASHRSFNNELGVPLTLLDAPPDCEVVIVEMGARGAGHVAALCSLAMPDIGVVTSVGAAHTEQFGTLDDVARAKGELVEALPASGTAVLNADDARVAAMAERTSATVITFGAAGDIRAEDARLDAELRATFTLVTPNGRAAVRLRAAGMHTVANALAAAAAGVALGVGVDSIAAGLSGATLSPWRMELGHAPSGAVVLNDAYNANPMSMTAALDALEATASTRRIAVLGVMAELGAIADAAHAAVGRRAAAAGIEVLAVGVDAYGGRRVDSAAEAIAVLDDLVPLDAGTAVLVKGSRVAGLEAVADWLLERA